jgi:sugar phosphate isomerase/epimerase
MRKSCRSALTLPKIRNLLKSFKKQAQESGIELSNYAVGANFSGLNDEQFEQELERLKREVDIAAALGMKKMRHDVASSQNSIDL